MLGLCRSVLSITMLNARMNAVSGLGNTDPFCHSSSDRRRQAGREAGKQGSRQAGKQAGRQVGIEKKREPCSLFQILKLRSIKKRRGKRLWSTCKRDMNQVRELRMLFRAVNPMMCRRHPQSGDICSPAPEKKKIAFLVPSERPETVV